jgi:PhzF family phenazine biosynthesis protein
MSRIPIFQVDAFTSRLFAGNPAAVCPLETWLPDAVMQSIAAENNLAETAFIVREPEGYRIRWFTPGVEVDLCGHATLAAAFVFLDRMAIGGDSISFASRSGELTVTRREDLYTLDFPSRPPEQVPFNGSLVSALGAPPAQLLGARDYLAVYDSEDDVRRLRPDMTALCQIDRFAVIVTAPGTDCDFVSRFFAPAKGVPEDPVTGSAHCTLTPYWSARLRKQRMRAKQLSSRGGELEVEDCGERVRISGRAVLYLDGFLSVP